MKKLPFSLNNLFSVHTAPMLGNGIHRFISRSCARISFLRRGGSVRTIDYVSKLNESTIIPAWPESSEQLTSMDRLFALKPSITAKDEEEEIDTEGLPEYFDFSEEEDGEPSPTLRLGRHILKLGKVHYRHEEALSPAFKEKKQIICDYRTVPQIRRCLKDWMVKSDRDNQFLYRKRNVGWSLDIPRKNNKGQRSDAKGGKDKSKNKDMFRDDDLGADEAVDAEEEAEARTIEEKKPIDYGPEDTVAYAHYSMPSKYGILKRIMREISTLLPNYKPTRVVDFGCGPGTAAASIMDTESWNDNGSFKKYVGIDISRSMIDAAKIVVKDSGVDAIFWDKTSEVVQRAHVQKDRYDMAVASFALSELTNDKNKIAAVQLMYEMLDDGGVLVIVEAGSPRGSHIVRSARQLILDSFNPSSGNNPLKTSGTGDGNVVVRPVLDPPPGIKSHEDVGAFVVAPCTHDKKCPLGDGVWCSFSQKVFSGMIRKAHEEKFSYVVIQKRSLNSYDARYSGRKSKLRERDTKTKVEVDVWTKDRNVEPTVAAEFSRGRHAQSNTGGRGRGSFDVSPAPLVQLHRTPVQILQEFMNTPAKRLSAMVDKLVDEIDWLEYTPPLYRSEYGRILRTPLKQRGHVTMDICTPAGYVKRHVLSKKHLLEIPSLYTAVRKTTWGGLHPILSSGDGAASPDGVAEESSPLCKLPPEMKNTSRNSDAVVDVDDEDRDIEEEIFEEEFRRMMNKKGKQKEARNRNVIQRLSPFSFSSLPTDKAQKNKGRKQDEGQIYESGSLDDDMGALELDMEALEAAGAYSKKTATGKASSRTAVKSGVDEPFDMQVHSLSELMQSGKLKELLGDDDDASYKILSADSDGTRARKSTSRSVGRQKASRVRPLSKKPEDRGRVPKG